MHTDNPTYITYAATHTDAPAYVTLTVVSIQGCSESYTEQGAATVFELPTAEFIMTQNGSIIDPAVISELSPWVDFINTSSSNVDSVYWNFDDPASDSANTSSLFNPTATDASFYLFCFLTLVIIQYIPLLTPSLPRCHLKTTNKRVKLEILKVKVQGF